MAHKMAIKQLFDAIIELRYNFITMGYGVKNYCRMQYIV